MSKPAARTRLEAARKLFPVLGPDSPLPRKRRWRSPQWLYGVAILEDWEAEDPIDLIAGIAAGGSIAPAPAVKDRSGDSLGAFYRRYPWVLQTYQELYDREPGHQTPSQDQRPTVSQETWEAWERGKRQAREAEADAAWDASGPRQPGPIESECLRQIAIAACKWLASWATFGDPRHAAAYQDWLWWHNFAGRHWGNNPPNRGTFRTSV
jgi:hypothetical protein